MKFIIWFFFNQSSKRIFFKLLIYVDPICRPENLRVQIFQNIFDSYLIPFFFALNSCCSLSSNRIFLLIGYFLVLHFQPQLLVIVVVASNSKRIFLCFSWLKLFICPLCIIELLKTPSAERFITLGILYWDTFWRNFACIIYTKNCLLERQLSLKNTETLL